MSLRIPQIGSLCISLKGHDKGRTYIVTQVLSPEYVGLCDGKVRKLKNPKKKRFKHVQVLNASADSELLKSIVNGTAKDNQLHKCLLNYQKSIPGG
ncbi:MAG: KOW domain-containing RNA-binding protein [Firmicutes bacterium]|nr:KOW domain-containing RNA-binding protein [Bacillota bacterium]